MTDDTNKKFEIKTTEPLTKKELNRICKRFRWFFNGGESWDRFIGQHWSWALIPLFQKYYQKDGLVDGMQRHSKLYNTELVFGSVIWGIVTAMEEQKAITGGIDDDIIDSTKISLMGPMAAIGDAINPGLIIPLLLSIAIALSESGSPVGAILYMIAYPLIVTFIMKLLFFKGYKLGINGVQTLIGEKANKIKNAVILFGTMIIGGVAASYVDLSIATTIPSGEEQVSIQGLLDGIFPKLVPLLLILGTYAFMKKHKTSTLTMIFVYMIGVMILSFFGIIGSVG